MPDVLQDVRQALGTIRGLLTAGGLRPSLTLDRQRVLWLAGVLQSLQDQNQALQAEVTRLTKLVPPMPVYPMLPPLGTRWSPVKDTRVFVVTGYEVRRGTMGDATKLYIRTIQESYPYDTSLQVELAAWYTAMTLTPGG
jgi:hypothetical protein